MKIVNRKEFLSLPSGVVYAKFEPCIFGDLAIKGETIGDNDWAFQDFLEVKAENSGEHAEILFDAFENGTSFELDLQCMGRDGLFKQEEHFAVFEQRDVISLIQRLQEVVTNYPTINE
jgi:hypothetical protein